jgi:urease accessory protein
MLLVESIIGTLDDDRFAGRRVEALPVDWAQAAKRRLRAESEAGTDVAVDLPQGAYLADGAVLHDDGERVLAVRRTPEPGLVIRFDAALPAAALAERAARLGHAFGNQHVPLDVDAGTIRVPLTTSEDVARRTVEALGLDGVAVTVEPVAFGRREPLAKGHAHG